MRHGVHLLSFVLAALLLWGCAGPQPELRRDLPAGFPNHSADQILHEIISETDTLRAYRAQARLTLESPSQSGRFSANMKHRRNDSLYFSISPGLGIEAARALVTPDSFFVYDRIQRRLTYGALEDASESLPAPLVGGTAFENLLGIVAPDPALQWAVQPDSGYYHLQDDTGQYHYTIDPAHWRVTEYQEFAPDGALLEERRFSEFNTFAGVTLPRRVVLRRPAEEAAASVYYRDIEINPAGLTFELDAAGARERVLVSHY